MRKYSRLTRLTLLSLTALMFMTASVLASTWDFEDVNNHWAKPYIQKMALKGIVKGMGGGIYAPNEEVTRLQSVIMLTRIKHPDHSIQAKPLPNQFEGQIPSWGEKYVALAVEEGIIAGEDLTDFRTDDPTKRYEAAVFAVRTLGLRDEAEAIKNIDLDFSDTYQIPMEVRGYIQVAVNEGIIQGYGDGSFKPQKTLTRAEAATIFYRVDRKLKNDVDDDEVSGVIESLDTVALPSVTLKLRDNSERTLYVNDSTSIFRENKKASLEDLKVGDYVTAIYNDAQTLTLYLEAFEEQPLQPEEQTVAYRGIIDNLDEELRLMVVNRNDGKKVSYSVEEQAEILLNDDPVDLDELVPGQSITFFVDKETNDVVKITAVGIDEVVEGKVLFVSYGGPIDKMIQIQTLDDEEKKLYHIAEDVVVTKNGEAATLQSILNYDLAELSVVNNKVVEIKAESKDKEVSGKLVEISYSGDNPEITLVLDDGDEITYEVDMDEVDIERNNDDAELGELLKGDLLELTLEYNTVTEIEAESVDRDIEGTVVGYSVGDEITITVLDEDDDERKTFILSPDARIKQNGETITYSDLNPDIKGSYVEMEVESEVIVKMYLEESSKATQFTGEIKAIHEDNNIIVVEKDNGNSVTVIVDDDTEFMRNNDTTRFSRLDEGDSVTVFGQYEGALFKATLVVITDFE